MPALGERQSASDVVCLSAGQSYSDIGAPTPTTRFSFTYPTPTSSGHETNTLCFISSPTAGSQPSRLVSNQLAPEYTASPLTDRGNTKEYGRRADGVGSRDANASPSWPMRKTKQVDRPNVNRQARFSVVNLPRRVVALSPDESAKRRSGDERLVKRLAPPVGLPSSSQSMPALPTISTTTLPGPIPSNVLSRIRSRTSTSTSTAASSAQSPASLVTTSPSPTPTPTTFSAGTVIALSTVLPTIILILLAIIIYLLRARRKASSSSRPRGNSANELPMVNIQQELGYSRSEAPFITLSRHSISPFNISLHDLSKSMILNGDNRLRRSPSRAGSEKSHVSSDSGVAHHSDAQLPTLPPVAVIRPEPPPTPVLAVRYSAKPSTDGPRPGQRASLFVDRTSMESGTVSSVVFARERTEEGSTGRISRDELSRWDSRDARTSLSDFPDRPRTGMEITRQPGMVPTEQFDTSGTSSTEIHGTRAPKRSGSKALKMLGIGPSSPYGLPSRARAHSRSHSQPVSTYGLPSLQLSPRARALRIRRQSPSETNPPGDDSNNSSGRPQRSDSRAETQRIHTPLPSSISRPSSIPSTTPEASSPRSSRERQPLSITIPPRLGTPIRPVAELIAMQSPPAQHTPRDRGPRSRSASRIPGVISPGQLADLGALDRLHPAPSRSRGMGDSEPSPETRERVLRLLGRLPENPQGEAGGQNEEGREGLPRSERAPRPHGTDRAREVRRTRSESELIGAFVQQSSDA